MAFNPTPLYGGAITVDLPTTFIDASNLRQIPDNQEVYLDANGFSSIVFDILERVEKPDDEALKVHVQDIVAGTGDETTVFREGSAVAGKMSTTPVRTLHFIQTPQQQANGARPSREQPDFTSIHLLLLRLAEQTTDIVITINAPHYPGKYAREEGGSADGKTQLIKDAEVVAQRILESFEVKDWGLFGGN